MGFMGVQLCLRISNYQTKNATLYSHYQPQDWQNRRNKTEFHGKLIVLLSLRANRNTNQQFTKGKAEKSESFSRSVVSNSL